MKKEVNLRTFSTLFFCLALALFLPLNAQTTWDGSTDSDWDNPDNWSAGVPDGLDDVTIPAVTTNDPVIDGNTVAVARSMDILADGSLTIQAMGSLNIIGSTSIDDLFDGTRGIKNYGTLNNNGGDIIIDTHGTGTYLQYSIDNYSMINNNGQIVIEGGVNGILSHFNATFNNNIDGIIQIDSYHLAFSNGGTLTNGGKIAVGEKLIPLLYSAGVATFVNTGILNNLSSGEITINNTVGPGFWNSLSGSATNFGKMKFGTLYAIGLQGDYTASAIVNHGYFINQSVGEIIIDNVLGSFGDGISTSRNLEYNSAVFINNGKITIGANMAVVGTGINIRNGTWTNGVSGEIQIEETGSYAIGNQKIMKNFGKITIGANKKNSAAMLNEGDFENKAGGEIHVEEAFTGIENGFLGTDSAVSFTNEGKITIGVNKACSFFGLYNRGLFTNTVGGEIQIEDTGGPVDLAGIVNVEGTYSKFFNSGKITIGANKKTGGHGIHNQAVFTNELGGDIQVDETGGDGVFNEVGTFTNLAKLTIGANKKPNGDGIENQATFNNQTCAAVIQVVSDNIISNTATFANEGTIVENATGTSSISDNTGVVFNLNGGTFNIGSGNPALTSQNFVWTGCEDDDWANAANWQSGAVPSAEDDAVIPNTTIDPIIMSGTDAFAKSVTVETGGKLTLINGSSLTIDDSSTDGILNLGTIENAGKITIGANMKTEGEGIENQGIFTNEPDGNIQVDETVGEGIMNNGGDITNFAKITIGANKKAGKNGLLNTSVGSFINEPGGDIQIEEAGEAGIKNLFSIFTNKGKITIGEIKQPVGAGIENNDIFQNQACAEIYLFDKLDAGVSSNITNDGLFSLNTSETHVPGNFTNNGIIEDIQGTFPIINNNEIIVAPLTVDGCEFISPAFDLGNNVDFTIHGIFSDADASQSAGSYDVGTNTFTADPELVEGTRDLFVEIEDGANGCSRIVKWKLTTQNCCAAPDAVCQNFTAQLDGTGHVTITPADVDDGSTAECGLQSLTIDVNEFDCSHTSAVQPVLLTITDVNGDSDNCSAMVTVVDNEAPVVNCPASIPDVVLNSSGSGTLPANIGDGSSTDNCSITETSPAMNFTCADLGMQTVTLTATDGSGNANTETCSFNVVDNTAPSANCPANIPDVVLDANGNGTLPANIGDGSSTDNCSVTETSPIASFGCADLGTQTITLTATDGSGNMDTEVCSFNVVDNISPIAICPAAIADVVLNANGNGTLPANIGDGSSTDNCSVVETSPVMSFTCADVGAHTVTLTVSDGANSTTTNCSFNVVDNEAPVAVCPASIPDVVLDASGNGSLPVDIGDGSSTDNCSATETSPALSFTCADVGLQTVILTADDGKGNSSSATCHFNVADNTGPDAQCTSATIQATLDANANYTIDPNGLDNGSSDACGGLTFSANPPVLTCADEGTNTVTLTVTDINGNSSNCTATVDVAPFVTISGIAPSAESCAGMGDGSITITASAGGGQLRYSIDGGTSFQFNNTFANLTPGTYNVVVKVFGIPNICEKTEMVTVGAGGATATWYKDMDDDGYSDGITQTGCSQPTGYKLQADLAGPEIDCNDNNPLLFPGQVWYKDTDNDGYSDGTNQISCTKPSGYKAASELIQTSGDCNDTKAAIHPNATETCNGLDDNCDGQVDEGLSGETYVGNVVFTTQSQLDAWPVCYSTVQGSVTVQSGNITNLGPLSNISTITDNLMIVTNSALTSINGLENLATVGGALYLYYNFQLSDCCAIDDLLTNGGVSGSIVIFFNASGSHCNSAAAIMAACPIAPLVVNPNDATISGGAVILQEGKSMGIYPNPASNEVNVLFNRAAPTATLRVMDMLGRLVVEMELEKGVDRVTIGLNNGQFENGLYLVSLYEEGEMTTKQLVIQQ